ncbi:MAG: NAD(P)H-hydrate epimerase [Cyanobacteriota bacterium]
MPWPRNDADHRLVRTDAMVGIEDRLFASGLPVEALMEKAALAVSRRLLEQHDTWLRRHGALVLVGPGHNGGDGLVVARELHLAGIPTRLWSPFERHRPLTDAHLRHALWLGLPKLEQPPEADDPALWIDALLGIGQRRPPGTAIESLLAARQQHRPHQLVAVDVPTGLCSDSGQLTGTTAATARCTYCIGLIKQGLLQDAALAWVGELERLDLGLPSSLLAGLPDPGTRILWPSDRATAPWPALPPAAGKYGRGRLLLLAGSHRYPGAAALAVAGASASGCGSLRAALPMELARGLWQQAPHVLLDPPLPVTADGSSGLGGLATSIDGRLDALLVGPGLGPDAGPASPDDGDAAAWDWLQRFTGLLVLDADGLNRLATRDGALWMNNRQGPTWITPHGHEFQRLFPDLSDDLPLEAASAAAERCQAAVLLKGARSVVADPEGRRWQLGQAEARSARTGLGDVLAGYAAGCGARALAALGGPEGHRTHPALASLGPSLAPWLAAAALDHAWAGIKACRRLGQGVTPMEVARDLVDGEIRTQQNVAMF